MSPISSGGSELAALRAELTKSNATIARVEELATKWERDRKRRDPLKELRAALSQPG